MRFRDGLVVVCFALGLAGCGGGGGGSEEAASPDPTSPVADPPIRWGTSLPADVHWQPRSGGTPSTGNYLYLDSDAGDAMGLGKTHLYTAADSSITPSYANGQYSFGVGHPSLQWAGYITATAGNFTFEPGFYGNAVRHEERGAGEPGMLWTTEWRRCDNVQGWFVVDDFQSDGDGLKHVVVRFSQQCNGSAKALKGKLRWSRADHRQTPIDPAPAGLWQPQPSVLPASGSYVYVESDADDFVGQGRTTLYESSAASMVVRRLDGFLVIFEHLYVTAGTSRLSGSLHGKNQTKLQRGYYPGVQRVPLHNIQHGAMEWSVDGRRCSAVNGWFAIDDVVYYEDQIVYLEMRFEQRCDSSQAALRGKVRWSLLDAYPPGPSAAPPDLWQPPAGATPPDEDYLYVESSTGDSVGGGITRLFSASSAALSGTVLGGSFHFRARADTEWVGDFKSVHWMPALRPGYYPSLPGLPVADSRTAGQRWDRDGRGCDAADGWVSIDSVTLAANGSIDSVALRFGQRCLGDGGGLRGKLRWSAAQSGRQHVLETPLRAWRPAGVDLPAQGNYLFFESDQEDAIGDGRSALLVASDRYMSAQWRTPGEFFTRAGFSMATYGGVSVSVESPLNESRLQPGLYGNLRGNTEFESAARMQVADSSSGCTQASGWYIVDRVAYVGDELTAIELRFGHSCDGSDGSLRGQLRWEKANQTLPAGPVQPPPPTLWKPRAGATPDAGNYLYLSSTYGDSSGQGRERLLTGAAVSFVPNAYVQPFGELEEAYAKVDVVDAGAEDWALTFVSMVGRTTLQPGFYDGAHYAGLHDRSKGGLSVGFCTVLSGWFAIDDIAYANGALQRLEVRFEQHCEGRSAPLRGKLRWQAP